MRWVTPHFILYVICKDIQFFHKQNFLQQLFFLAISLKLKDASCNPVNRRFITGKSYCHKKLIFNAYHLL